MDDEINPLEEHGSEIPRWIRVPIGLVLGLVTLGLAYASTAGLLLTLNEKAPVLVVVVGVVLPLLCFWLLEKCFRLVTGRRNRGGLMSPTALRVLSVFFLVPPVAGLFTGYYREMGAAAALQAVMYLVAFVGLQKLARKRETAADFADTTGDRTLDRRDKG